VDPIAHGRAAREREHELGRLVRGDARDRELRGVLAQTGDQAHVAWSQTSELEAAEDVRARPASGLRRQGGQRTQLDAHAFERGAARVLHQTAQAAVLASERELELLALVPHLERARSRVALGRRVDARAQREARVREAPSAIRLAERLVRQAVVRDPQPSTAHERA